MANLTFSKKGVPMGRNKSKADHKNKAWTGSEDGYIKLAVEKGLSAATVAAKLGRSIAAVQNRKWFLGLEGRFSNSPRGLARNETKRTAKTVNTVKAVDSIQLSDDELPQGLRLMTLESGVPLPSRGNRNDEAREQMRNLFTKMKVGQSFVVPRKLVHVGVYLINKEFDDYRVKTSATSAEKKFFRIFRIA